LTTAQTLITPHSHFEGEKYYDPKSSKLFTLNQLELKTNSAEEVDQLSYKNEARSLLEKSLDSYVEEYFSNGTAAVYTSLKNIQGSLQSQEEQDTVEEAKDSDSNKETARNTENTEMTEAEHGTEEEQNEDNKDKEDKEEQKKDNEDVETPQEQEQEQKEDNEDAEKPEEQPEEPVEDKPIEESKEPEGSVPAETTQVHQETTEDTTENTPSEEITSMNICYAGNKFNQSNYWSGRWRANWVYDLTTNELIGNINITIHYFENGNVQLQASHNPKIKSPLEGPPTTEEEAKKLVKAISESDRAYQAYINVLYEDKLIVDFDVILTFAYYNELKMINVAIIGVGNSSNLHIPFIEAADELKLTHVLERKATKDNSVAKDKWKHLEPFTVVNKYEDILNDSSVQLVVITTSNTSHYDLTKEALKHGKNVVIEKPITPSSEQALELADLATKNDLILAVFHNRRYDGDFLTVSKLIKEGKLGEISSFESRFDRYRPTPKSGWREENAPGSGVLFDLGSHLIDQAVNLFGKPQQISAIVQNSRQKGDLNVDDSFLVHLHYNNKIPLTFTAGASVLACFNDQLRYKVSGTEGSFLKYGFDVQEAQIKDGLKALDTKFGVDDKSAYGTYTSSDLKTETIETTKGAWIDFYRNVAKSINKTEPLAVDPYSAALTIRLIELAHQSAKEGRRIDIS
ncbi:NAD(P)-binding protein, partial [Wallemia mellicola]